MTPARSQRLPVRAIAIAFLAIPLAGCWGAQFVRMPNYTEETRADVMDLAAESAADRERVLALETAIAEQTALIRAMRAELSGEIGALNDRLTALEERLGSQEERRSRGSAFRAPDLAPALADSSARAAATASENARAVYDAAYLELLKGNYDLAVEGFDGFLAQYPESDLADNAQYWIGECHLARGETSLAMTAFLGVESRWPRGDKVPGALLKVAHCLSAEHEVDASRRTLESLVARFPKTEEARLAQERLAKASGGR